MPPSALMDRIARTPLLLFALLAATSLPLRLPNLQAPLSGEHEFRQTQTALSVWEIREHGFSLLHPRLPLFGPPWECPFEYPVFQIAAATVDSLAPWNNLDVSIRITNLVFYYLTSLTLYLLALRLFRSPGVALFASAVFFLAPYNVVWSRSSMIEYAATFFALGYFLLLLRWLAKPTARRFALCSVFGILACLTKITTFVLPLFIAGGLTALHVLSAKWRKFPSKDANRRDSATTQDPDPPSQAFRPTALNLPRLALLAALLVVPVVPGFLYVKYSDKIKEESPFTAWLSSSHPYTKAWTYGTIAQRLSPRNWDLIQHRMRNAVMPTLTFALAIGFLCVPLGVRGFEGLPGGNFWIGCCVSLSPIVAALTFFNLYCIHTYYYIACAPILALITGAGLQKIFDLLRRNFLRLVFVLLLCALWLQTWSSELGRMFTPPPPNPRVEYLSAASKLIGKDEPVIILSAREWSGFAPYHLKRRAFMAMFIKKPVDTRPLLDTDYFKQNGFRWLLLEDNAPGMSELATGIMSRWKTSRKVAVPVKAPYVLYSLSDD